MGTYKKGGDPVNLNGQLINELNNKLKEMEGIIRSKDNQIEELKKERRDIPYHTRVV